MIILWIILILVILILGYDKIYRNLQKIRNIRLLQKYKIPLYKVKFKYNYHKYQIPIMPFRVNDRLYYFILDTGANINIIDKQFYENNTHYFHGCEDESDPIFGIGPNISAKKTSLNMIYGNKNFNNTEFKVVDISQITDRWNGNVNKQIVGILGCKFMEEHSFKIDFSELCIWLDRF